MHHHLSYPFSFLRWFSDLWFYNDPIIQLFTFLLHTKLLVSGSLSFSIIQDATDSLILQAQTMLLVVLETQMSHMKMALLVLPILYFINGNTSLSIASTQNYQKPPCSTQRVAEVMLQQFQLEILSLLLTVHPCKVLA